MTLNAMQRDSVHSDGRSWLTSAVTGAIGNTEWHTYMVVNLTSMVAGREYINDMSKILKAKDHKRLDKTRHSKKKSRKKLKKYRAKKPDDLVSQGKKGEEANEQQG